MSLATPRNLPSFFAAPPQGRQIIAGFSYLQRIRKGASTRVWFPDPFLDRSIEWAAVREFELLQEADNLMIDDLDIMDMNRTARALSSMRGGGYRVAMISLGCYTENSACDDLKILDEKLQEEITRMIQFLYLGEASQKASAAQKECLDQENWSCADALPHITMTLGAHALYKRGKETTEEKVFFDILERLPARHIVHNMAIGLALPDKTKEKNWVYVADGEKRAGAFFSALDKTIGTMINHHMRGYGDRLTPKASAWQRQAAHALVN